jgi:hypothetical protein
VPRGFLGDALDQFGWDRDRVQGRRQTSHGGHALLAQHPLDAAHGHAPVMQQNLDPAHEFHVRRPVIASPTGALHRADLGEFRFPETQHMSRHAKPVGDLTYGTEGVGRLAHGATPVSG